MIQVPLSDILGLNKDLTRAQRVAASSSLLHSRRPRALYTEGSALGRLSLPDRVSLSSLHGVLKETTDFDYL